MSANFPPGAVLTAADIEHLAFDKQGGLLPAIIEDPAGSVRMLGYMSREALLETFKRRRVVFYSRSRRQLWEKGETSGHTLEFIAARTDCDRDTLLITARPTGPVCHLGTASCFGEPHAPLGFLTELEALIAQRIAARPEGSYTARLYAEGVTRMAQKVGEEGIEVALAAAVESADKLLAESADLLYHLALLLASRGLSLEDVSAELRARHAAKP
ncbi:MAG: bifunctional phosphoribosyl-AMP cyclohydrolase/phosphoribosyl-ATP diphosphatase HisIE [Steroidobacteraceae bacterium]|jgi:phosphoribosyl-ATP pyrophosphohydrolase/phosphoribosyl-AMP cyclohydrolase